MIHASEDMTAMLWALGESGEISGSTMKLHTRLVGHQKASLCQVLAWPRLTSRSKYRRASWGSSSRISEHMLARCTWWGADSRRLVSGSKLWVATTGVGGKAANQGRLKRICRVMLMNALDWSSDGKWVARVVKRDTVVRAPPERRPPPRNRGDILKPHV